MKKLVCFVVALMVCLSAVAFAGPSKTTSETVIVESAKEVKGIEQTQVTDAAAAAEGKTATITILGQNDATTAEKTEEQQAKEAKAQQNAQTVIADIQKAIADVQAEKTATNETVTTEQAVSEAIVNYFTGKSETANNTVITVDFSKTNTDNTTGKQPESLSEMLLTGEKANDTLTASEIIPVVAENFSTVAMNESVEITYEISTDTKYVAGEKVAVMVGIVDANGNIQWSVLDGTTTANGVEVALPGDIIAQMQGDGIVMSVVSASSSIETSL